MHIRILLILLALSLVLAFSRRWRIPGMVVSALLTVLLIWFTVNQPGTSQYPGKPPPAVSSSVASQATIVHPEIALQLEGNGAPWRLSGTITNQSDNPVRSITLNVERLDCPAADSAEVDCNLVWRGQHTLRSRIAANSKARIEESFYSHETLSRHKGIARDHITVVSIQ